VRLLLTCREDCPRAEQLEASRLYLENGDIDGALRRMPRFLVVEPALLKVSFDVAPLWHLSVLVLQLQTCSHAVRLGFVLMAPAGSQAAWP
jgi:hypothetical protein